MKNEARRYVLKGIIIAIVIMVIGAVGAWLLYNVDAFNNAIRGWMYSFVHRFSSGSVVSFNWANIVLAASGLWILFSILIAVVATLPAYLASRNQRHRQTQLIAEYIERVQLAEKQMPHLPSQYATIEMPLLRMKADATRAQQLAETEMQRKNDLITYLAHDLKTPLASVIGYLNLLDEAPELPSEQRAKYVGITLDKAYRLEQLIGELFEIIRFNLQSITLNTERINLPFMLDQMADEFYPILRAQGKSIRVEAANDLILTGDSDKLARVFNNILKNAAAYSDDNTEIEIAAEQRDSEIVISFKNHGEAIPPHKQAVIFEKFYRLDTSRSSKTGGAGLGLAIAKEIVEAHHGAISVTSGAQGTVFTTRFPIENRL